EIRGLRVIRRHERHFLEHSIWPASLKYLRHASRRSERGPPLHRKQSIRKPCTRIRRPLSALSIHIVGVVDAGTVRPHFHAATRSTVALLDDQRSASLERRDVGEVGPECEVSVCTQLQRAITA